MGQLKAFTTKTSKTSATDGRAERYVDVIQTILEPLSAAERDQVLKLVTERLRPNPRAGDVLGTIVQLFQQRNTWATDDLRDQVPKEGVSASPKEIYNALSYLVRQKRIKRIGYGQYVVMDLGAAIEMNDEDDGRGPSSEHFT